MPENPQGTADDDLQFRKAEPAAAAPPEDTTRCASCSEPIADEYYHAQGQVVCANCAARIEAGQQAPPTISIGKAALYGGAAAFAGFVLYALVAIVAGLELGILAIFIGIMVGKAVRHGSHGLGGRPQQILAVVLTYFSISVSNVPVFLWHYSRQKPAAADANSKNPGATTTPGENQPPSNSTPKPEPRQPRMSAGAILITLLGLGLASPFLILANDPGSGALSLVIILFGLQRAWALTGRSDILVMGPYKLEPVP